MHHLAIVLAQKGHIVTGSDDAIFDPALSNLAHYNLTPDKLGYYAERITKEIDILIIGMHAKADNVELCQAQSLGVPVLSFPEFFYSQIQQKTRIVIAGSHGKTTTTSMLAHVFNQCSKSFDYLFGSSISGFKHSVAWDEKNEIAIIEGDEYLASPINLEPKFIFYKPHIVMLTGIAWDHINVFPTFASYKMQFEKLIAAIEPNGILIYNAEDAEVLSLVKEISRNDLQCIPYQTLPYVTTAMQTKVTINKITTPLHFFGKHNIQNLSGAWQVAQQLAIDTNTFSKAIGSYRGVAKRLEKVFNNQQITIYRDFAHAPSKVAGSVAAVAEAYPTIPVIACLELHTFSSLQADFLPNYISTLDKADIAIVYVSPTVRKKKESAQQPITNALIQQAFGRKDLHIVTDPDTLKELVQSFTQKNESVLLLMSSGNFDNLAPKDFIHST